MTTDQLTTDQKTVSDSVSVFLDSRGWGFGVAVVTKRDDVAATPGATARTAAWARPGLRTPRRT
jgi:hypothetical protein